MYTYERALCLPPIPPPFTKEGVLMVIWHDFLFIMVVWYYLINLVVACRYWVHGYFSNMQIYNEECVLQVVCAMECVHRDERWSMCGWDNHIHCPPSLTLTAFFLKYLSSLCCFLEHSLFVFLMVHRWCARPPSSGYVAALYFKPGLFPAYVVVWHTTCLCSW